MKRQSGDAFTSRRAHRRPRPRRVHRHCHRRGPLQHEYGVTRQRKFIVQGAGFGKSSLPKLR